jgi:hypothetical protein
LHPEVAHAAVRGSGTHGNIPHAIATFRTPRPWTFTLQGRSPGLRVVTSDLPSQCPQGISGRIDRMLAAYSCGGSSGIAWPIMGLTHRIPVLASDANRKNLEH